MRFTMRIVAALGGLVFALAVLAPPGLAQQARPAQEARPARQATAMQCADLAGKTLDLPGAVTHVTSTGPTQENGTTYCRVEGYVEPHVRFVLRLPSTYNGRYLQYGCDGLCGIFREDLFPSRCTGGVPGDMALAVTDDGHHSDLPFPLNLFDGKWAANDRAARDDYEFRAPHVVSRASKEIIKAYYGSAPVRSYFKGCSTGGREGLLLAQRYPHDFNGIIAGDPTNYNGALNGVYFTWMVRSNLDGKGGPILTQDKLSPLHQAVLKACDARDGLKDGMIDDPAACTFDPASVACPPGTDRPTCLTPAQVTVVRKLYAGPTDAKGRRLYPGGEPYGSEEGWAGASVPVNGATVSPLADSFLKYLGYPIGKPASSVADFTFTVAELNRLTAETSRGNALGLDLRRFRQAGGKLIMWHGAADQSIPPASTLDYYQRLWERNGGLARTRQFARMFLVPAVYHCAAEFLPGYKLNAFDPLPGLVRWVENGQAPAKVIAEQRDAGKVVATRPVFAYPERARYLGTGSIDDARNFVSAPPLTPPRNVIHWAGDYLYDVPGPVAR
ncbi:tannase/feruloyl esterase family alpha/beta hydrolase [Actinomadura barringtoniae]|uniref:Tannase/feruloyl esterase family alpha/beta hydrolase n=1 Tax=Actinomadura barringtoniae TaxID=1427535 RepID=A0A939T153_9ACTN|nr:tannase/feruloyl esterase family alpha/beta hydrolase [Actinomadura barringtoniae]MBO2446796.1 tannase/feruloyl esterase family alpha/beta hydrolase [Actinomadura barringtoniae]